MFISTNRHSLTYYLLLLALTSLALLLTACQESIAEEMPTEQSHAGALSTTEPPTIIPSPAQPSSPTPEPYGWPTVTPTLPAYGYPSAERTVVPAPTLVTTLDVGNLVAYLPFAIRGLLSTPSVSGAASATATGIAPAPTLHSTPTAIRPSPTPEPIPTLDVVARQAELAGTDRQLAFSKIGFHVTFLEEKGMLDQWMQEQDAAGIPFYLKTVDNAEPLYKAQQLVQESGVPHTLVFRATGGVPDYSLPPDEAARQHWEFHRDKFPPELDPQLVWVETVNEVDKNRSAWLAEFALETARLTMADGFRWAAFGWAPGEPEPEHWQLPAMLEFLRLAGENPDRLAIAVHEGSLSADDIRALYPFRLGRFMRLFEICDQNDIPRPTVLITEWGWEYNNIPPVEQAMADIAWAANLYANFPEVKGAAIWNLGTGCCFGTVSDEVRQLIDPLRRFNLATAYTVPRPPLQSSTDSALYR